MKIPLPVGFDNVEIMFLSMLKHGEQTMIIWKIFVLYHKLEMKLSYEIPISMVCFMIQLKKILYPFYK